MVFGISTATASCFLFWSTWLYVATTYSIVVAQPVPY